MGWVCAETDAGSVAIDASIGNLRELRFAAGSRRIEPLHTAHWVGQERIPSSVAPVERNLSGDFFCAPFGAAEVDGAPPHGLTANSNWTVTRLEDGQIDFSLDASVMGAKITKGLRLAKNAPILYQTHLLTGGQGGLTVAHHPMIRLESTGRLSVSPKRAVFSPEVPLEAGRHALACPARTADLETFPSNQGGTLDLTKLPIASGCEDFVTLVEVQGATLGWSAIIRDTEDDIVFFLKDPRILPVTMLWHSNGGRDYAPWSGQHEGVIGIEDGCAAGAEGHRKSLSPNPISEEGAPTFLTLGERIEIRHVIGALPRPKSWMRVANIRVSGANLILTEENGADLSLPFDPDFFTEAP